MSGAMNDEEEAAPAVSFVRLALRVEDGWWVAYMTEPASMERATELGRIRLNAARIPQIGDAWKALMCEILTFTIKAALGADVISFSEERGPEAERPDGSA